MTPPNRTLNPIYAPNREEQLRQDFVLGLKLLANGPAQEMVRSTFKQQIEPEIRSALGRAPERREEVETDLARTTDFRQWAVLAHRTQSMMWNAIEATTRRVNAEAERRLARLRESKQLCGSLELNPQLAIPAPIGNTEIHRQPGGYVGGADPDLTPGLRYVGASAIYSVGKGNPAAAGDGRGLALAQQIRARFPQLRPRRILDLGCGVGVHAQAIAREFPDAEYHAVDVAAGLLRLGHVLAEERGIPIHFYQRDAAHTGFPDGHFDLILSHIFFHETNSARLPQILRECRRLLAPGGGMLHLDVATQMGRLPLADQVMNHWQVRWNGEPFWTGFAQRDMRAEIEAAGFFPETVFAEYPSKGPGNAMYIFGAAAPVS